MPIGLTTIDPVQAGGFHLRWITRYAIAVGTVALAVLLRLFLQHFIEDEAPFLLLFAAVLVSTTLGGLGPGVLATVLGALASGFVFASPQVGFDGPGFVRLLLFLGEGAFISVLGARLQTARRRAETSEAEARYLEQKMLDISDDERRRIGQDLHDGLGQHLTGVAFLSKALQQRLQSKDLPEAADATKIASLVSESIGQTRLLAKGLAPVGLEEGGLVSALTQLALATSSVFGIDCSCSCNGSEDVEQPDLAVATHLYRIAQEAVNNAIRHGHGNRIAVSLHSDGRTVRLRIEDNGSGISPRNDHGGGMGLQIMGFRARMIGASLKIQRRDATGGTVVTCSAPLT